MTWNYPGALSIKMVFSVRVIFGNVGGFRKKHTIKFPPSSFKMTHKLRIVLISRGLELNYILLP